MLRDFFLCTVVRHCLMRNFTHRWFSVHSYHRVDFCRPACLTRVPNGSKIIQLFRQRLSRISIKAYATIPIGIVGAKSLVFSRVRFKVIQQQGSRKNEHTCLCNLRSLAVFKQFEGAWKAGKPRWGAPRPREAWERDNSRNSSRFRGFAALCARVQIA